MQVRSTLLASGTSAGIAGRSGTDSLHRFPEVSMSLSTRSRLMLAAGAVLFGGLTYACAGSRSTTLAGSGDNARRVYVAPGEHDELYAFLSGGFGGQVGVYGLPSGRLLRTVPVFSQHAENGWGYSEETKPMLETSYGFIPWDDLHHTALSQTKGGGRRALALRERQQHAARRQDRPHALRDDRDPGDPQRRRQPRLAVRDGEQ